jgi:hypothetical protein
LACRRYKFFRLPIAWIITRGLNRLTGQSGARPPHSKKELHPEYIIPSVFDRRVAEAVAKDVEEAAYHTHVAHCDRAAVEGMRFSPRSVDPSAIVPDFYDRYPQPGGSAIMH